MEIMVSARYKKGTHESEPVTVLSICAYIAHVLSPKAAKLSQGQTWRCLLSPGDMSACKPEAS